LSLHNIKVEPLESHGLFWITLTGALGLESCNDVAVYGGQKPLGFHQRNILICVPKMVWNDMRAS